MTPNAPPLQDIPEDKPVRVFLPITGKIERYRTGCVFRQGTDQQFTLVFKPGTLPYDALDLDATCLITIDMGGPTLSVEAAISEVVDSQTLSLSLEKSISHEQMREFFRVDATTPVISSSFTPEFFSDSGEPWRVKGKTIDISGSGLLAMFPEMVPMDKQVRLEITLPACTDETISVLAKPVRAHKVADDQYEVAYHFDDISDEDRDRIIGCCLIIQRQLLRLKVQVKNTESTR